MKKILCLLMVFFLMGLQAQEMCAFDQVQKELEQKHPEMRERRISAEKKLRSTDVRAYLNEIGASFTARNYTGNIYEIPVVVHVIESSGTNAQPLTDAQIQTWIDNANQMYATTYGNGFYEEGDGADGGTVIPFKLVIAKRDPQCNATSGIIRYNGDTLTGYAQYGMKKSGDNGPASEDIVGLAPHWPEGSYYNMYIITGFDGNYTNYGLMGYAGYPTNSDAYYHTFMKAPVVTKTNDSTLAHEFGHSLGLRHPFDGASSQGGQCPTNGDCTTDNDKVCDTAPTQSLLSVNPTPSNADTNPCTGTNYEGVQYNIMNYTYSNRKFTPGQRERAILMFMQNRGSLTTSLGGIPPSTTVTEDVTPATCVVTGVTNTTGNPNTSYKVGPVNVVLGTISNPTSAINGLGSNAYVDYTVRSCQNSAFSTEIPKDNQSTIKITITGANNQSVKAWIDFNNNGTFEDTEIIANETYVTGPGWGNTTEKNYTFTPPTDAVVNTNLRMRVSADLASNIPPCGAYAYGQAEDYMVKITTTLGVSDVASDSAFTIVYSESDNTLNLLNSKEKLGNYQVFDFSGKLIQSGNSDNQTIKLNTTPKGGYILQFEYKGELVSHKFLK